MEIDFTDMRVLVTGGTRGIGSATARAFLNAGAKVAVNGRSSESTAAGIIALGDNGMVFEAPGDVATVAGCRAIVDGALDRLGGLDILVNSAGVASYGPARAVQEADWDRMIDVNLKGTFFCIQAALEALHTSKGNIVNLASDAGLIGVSELSAYCASKAAVVNLTKALSLELAPNVRVNCVCPGYVDTDMVRRDGIEAADDPYEAEQTLIKETPLKRLATPDEIANAILYLASKEAEFITGSALQIDGGTTAGF